MPAGREDDARGFYVEVLGFTEVPKPEHLRARGGCWFGSGEVELHLGVEEGFRPARKAHPAFLVEDLDGLRSRLKSNECQIVDDTQLEGHRRFYTSDPFGNRIELIETVAQPQADTP